MTDEALKGAVLERYGIDPATVEEIEIVVRKKGTASHLEFSIAFIPPKEPTVTRAEHWATAVPYVDELAAAKKCIKRIRSFPCDGPHSFKDCFEAANLEKFPRSEWCNTCDAVAEYDDSSSNHKETK